MEFLNVGFSNLVAAERIVTLAAPDSAPLKRLIGEGREEGRVIDCSCGKKVRCVIITDSDHIILSTLPPDTLAARLDGRSADTAEENTEDAL